MEPSKENVLLKKGWFVLIPGIVVAAVFLRYGIHWLMLAYSMNNPYEFLMFFFSASMVILINATLLVILLVTAAQKLRSQVLKD